MAVNQQKLMGRTTSVQAANVAPQQQLVASPADTALLKDISKSLTNIIQLLSNQNIQTKKDVEQTRKTQERTRRKGIELGLERSFATVKNVASAVVAPVKSILDQIIQFFVTIFLGRALILLLNWFADENNRSKVRSIMRFLRDWWPSLVASYILFGTGFGRVVRSVAKIGINLTARLGVILFRLGKAIATGQILKRQGIASVFAGGGKLGGVKGGLLKFGLGASATVGAGFAINKFMGGGEEQTPQLDVPEPQTVPGMGAFGGGLADLKGILSSTGSEISTKLNPFTSFFSSGGLASVMQGFGGSVSGPKGIDKVPAMLTDGEFVMSRGAVQKFGVNTLQAMNSAGGGTNRPKIIHGIPHAAGGGLIGKGEPPMKDGHPETQNSQQINVTPKSEVYNNKSVKVVALVPVSSMPQKKQNAPTIDHNILNRGIISGAKNINFNMNTFGGGQDRVSNTMGDVLLNPQMKFINNQSIPSSTNVFGDKKILDGMMNLNQPVNLERNYSSYFPLLSAFMGDSPDKSSPVSAISSVGENVPRSSNTISATSPVGMGIRKSKNQIPLSMSFSPNVFMKKEKGSQQGISNKGSNIIEHLQNLTNTIFNRNLDQKTETQTIQEERQRNLKLIQSPQNIQNLENRSELKISRSKSNSVEITPTPRPAPRIVTIGSKSSTSGMSVPSKSPSNPSLPSFSASNTSHRLEANLLGIG